ncbi:hypothetical protein OBBRIDRAFT_59265 [Obba rivulosa]|uniref:Uncharacterized protein n=1 Tax=Obba rivulosa TaxID=1052685 RepID=A0A8E2AVM0_9APHY|nr:hypothetical protein OBBRIDRAFT_59265 [Obba rivulosa]
MILGSIYFPAPEMCLRTCCKLPSSGDVRAFHGACTGATFGRGDTLCTNIEVAQCLVYNWSGVLPSRDKQKDSISNNCRPSHVALEPFSLRSSCSLCIPGICQASPLILLQWFYSGISAHRGPRTPSSFCLTTCVEFGSSPWPETLPNLPAAGDSTSRTCWNLRDSG